MCPRLLNNDSDIIELDLSDMLLNDDNLAYICDSLSNNDKVKKFNFSKNKNLTFPIKYLLELLEKNKKIDNIEIENNEKITEDMLNNIQKKLLEFVNNINYIIYII